ncbi:MAG TPA: SRPBCC family protein [Candidatus Limnocylindria bacterium]|nr:SRPBCC family protein [Candidatus Limnocylindria bacterium]
MITYRVDIAVDRPADDVFPFLADIATYPQWMGGISTEAISPGPLAPGFRYRYQMDEGEFEFEVTSVMPGRGFSARTVTGPMDWTGTFEVDPDGDGRSRVVSSGSVGLRGIRRLIEPLAGGEVRQREQAELERLKNLVEGQTVGAAAG